jgi:hypothetical protein
MTWIKMPFHKDPKPSAEEKHQKHSTKDINLLVLGTRGVGKSGKVFFLF